MIKHDRSPVSIVTTCTDCNFWWAFSFTDEEAFASGERHLVNVHDLPPNKAAEARRSYERRKRHAVVA